MLSRQVLITLLGSSSYLQVLNIWPIQVTNQDNRRKESMRKKNEWKEEQTLEKWSKSNKKQDNYYCVPFYRKIIKLIGVESMEGA